MRAGLDTRSVFRQKYFIKIEFWIKPHGYKGVVIIMIRAGLFAPLGYYCMKSMFWGSVLNSSVCTSGLF
jgi:hypothetical protein